MGYYGGISECHAHLDGLAGWGWATVLVRATAGPRELHRVHPCNAAGAARSALGCSHGGRLLREVGEAINYKLFLLVSI